MSEESKKETEQQATEAAAQDATKETKTESPATAADSGSEKEAPEPNAAKEPKPAKPAGKADSSTEKEGKTDTRSAVELLLDPGLGEQQKIVKAKGSKNITTGIANILATFNNTIVSITDRSGNVIGWSSAGKCGFKGSRKSTAYAAQMVAQDASRQAMGHGLKEVEVKVKGPGSGRESAVRALQAMGLDVTTISDVTPVPHNGCRPPKQRRV